jgi:hypothetical protein
MVTITLTPREARILLGAIRLAGADLSPSVALRLALSGDATITVDGARRVLDVLHRVAARIEMACGCKECGLLDAHTSACNLRNPDRD